MMASSVVPNNAGACSLVAYLSRRFTYFTESQWRSRVSDGKILHNGTVATDASAEVVRGDTVAYILPDIEEPPADFDYRIVYEDDWILGVDKPGNLLVHKAGRSIRSNLVYQLRYCHKPAAYPRLNAVNRLDRETSGVVLFAKDAVTLSKMNKALTKRIMRKEYIAIVKGSPSRRAWTSNFPIGKDESSTIHYKFRIDCIKGKDAETRFEAIRVFSCSAALLRVRPVTGRTHQIRVHLAACGLPIVGDKLYGMSENDFLAWRRNPDSFRLNGQFPRQALHCASIAFEHPSTGKETVVSAPLPSDMEHLLKTYDAPLIPETSSF
jgi:RluA family pseudouridine synthase